MADADGIDGLRVEVVFSPAPRIVWQWSGVLPPGSVAGDALRLSGVLDAHPELDPSACSLGIWGQRVAAGRPLAEGDRVETCRPLVVDPKEARRRRDRAQREGLAPPQPRAGR